MLRTIADIKECTVGATDGDIGSIEDVYFDDKSWTVRYLVVDTGAWLPGRKVLISPHSIRKQGHDDQRILVQLTQEQVRNSPDMDTAQPISRQAEIAYSQYYGYQPYWEGPYRWGAGPFPLTGSEVTAGLPAPAPPRSAVEAEVAARVQHDRERADDHLRSALAVTDYYIHASDGEIGHVEELIVDDADWAMRYFIVDTRNWLPGKRVLVAPEWIDHISFDDSTVFVAMRREAIESAPEYDPKTLERGYERQLYAHYAKPGYWEDASATQERSHMSSMEHQVIGSDRKVGGGMQINREQLVNLLNEDLAREYQAVISYVNYSQVIKGAAYMSIAAELERHAAEELAHALKIAKQIDYLGGEPTVTPKPVKTSQRAEDMLRFDLDNEVTTITQYRERIRQAESVGEFALAEELRQIIADEQEHAIDLSTALGIDVPNLGEAARERKRAA